MNMDFLDFTEFIRIGKEKEQEEALHRQWVSLLPGMSAKEFKYMSFKEYCDMCTGRNIDTRPSDDIIAELEALHGHKLI